MRRICREKGYNLVEVLIAMGLLSTVLLAVMTLFVLGRRNVNSGRQMTHAVSIGTRITEDLSAMTLDDVYTHFNVADGAAIPPSVTLPTPTLPESTYTNSFLRSTANVTVAGRCTGAPLITFANDPSFYLRRWWCQLQGTAPLPRSSISLIITPRKPNGNPLSAGPNTGNATVLRVRAVVRWSEGLRPRQAIFDTDKYERPLPP